MFSNGPTRYAMIYSMRYDWDAHTKVLNITKYSADPNVPTKQMYLHDIPGPRVLKLAQFHDVPIVRLTYRTEKQWRGCLTFKKVAARVAPDLIVDIRQDPLYDLYGTLGDTDGPDNRSNSSS